VPVVLSPVRHYNGQSVTTVVHFAGILPPWSSTTSEPLLFRFQCRLLISQSVRYCSLFPTTSTRIAAFTCLSYYVHATVRNPFQLRRRLRAGQSASLLLRLLSENIVVSCGTFWSSMCFSVKVARDTIFRSVFLSVSVIVY